MRPDRPVVFLDVMGTLFALSALRTRLEAIGAPPLTLEAWFGRLLHSAAALSLVDAFEPFPDLARSTLRATLAQLELDPDEAGGVLPALSELDPHPEVPAALERLRDAGATVVALTNGTAGNTRALFERSGLEGLLERTIATDAVRAYKPDPRVYDHAVSMMGIDASQATLIAAHAWDVLGARAAGLRAIWVSRLERVWPLPVSEPEQAPDVLAAVELALR